MATGNSGWQTSVGTLPTPGIPGDFSDFNPRSTLDAGPGGLVAGSAGVTVGYFGWTSYQGIDPDNAPTVVNCFSNQGAAPSGFIAREQQGLITTYLADASMVVPKGFGVTLFTSGGFWVKNDGTTAALVGMKAYADLATGKVSFAPTGSPGSASVTGSIAAGTGSLTGSVAGNVLTVTNVASGTVVNGALLYGTVAGSGVIANTRIVSQLSGTAGSTGTYALSIPEQLVLSGTLSLSYGILTVSAVSSGTIENGALVSGTGVAASPPFSHITQLGTGGTGTYYLDVTQAMSSSALTLGNTIETRFYALSSGQAGEVVKMSDRVNVGP
jgi:hypothetical protein